MYFYNMTIFKKGKQEKVNYSVAESKLDVYDLHKLHLIDNPGDTDLQNLLARYSGIISWYKQANDEVLTLQKELAKKPSAYTIASYTQAEIYLKDIAAFACVEYSRFSGRHFNYQGAVMDVFAKMYKDTESIKTGFKENIERAEKLKAQELVVGKYIRLIDKNNRPKKIRFKKARKRW